MTPSPSRALAARARGRCAAVRRRRRPGLGGLVLHHVRARSSDSTWRGGELAVAQRRVQVLHLAVAVFAGDPLEVRLGHLAELHAQPPRFLLQILLADFDRLDALAGVDDVLDLVARARGLDERQPVLAGLVAGLRHDLDDVAVAQRVAQRHDAAVHLGADAGVAHVGVDGVGEIDGGGVARQHDHLAARREGVDLFRVQVHLQGGHELAGVLHVALPFHQVAQPGDALIVGRRPLAALLVLPVRRDAFLGDAVHLLGADLHLEGLPVRTHHRGVQRLVEVGPRDGDEVLDAPGNRAPLVVDHAQRGVAVLHRVGDDAQRHQVVDLVERIFCRRSF